MFELNSIRELNHRLGRLMNLSTGGIQKQFGNGPMSQDIQENVENQFNSGFPTHMNLELNKSVSQNTQHQNLLLERQVQRLKEQNRQLTQEVGQKSNRVTALEQEKRTVIKQLFHRPPAHHPAQMNNDRKQKTSGLAKVNQPCYGHNDKAVSKSMGNLQGIASRNKNFPGAKSFSAASFASRQPTATLQSASSVYQQQF